MWGHDEVGTSTQRASQVPFQLHHTIIFFAAWSCGSAFGCGPAVNETQRASETTTRRKTRVCIVMVIYSSLKGYGSVTKISMTKIHWKYVQLFAQPCLARRLCPCSVDLCQCVDCGHAVQAMDSSPHMSKYIMKMRVGHVWAHGGIGTSTQWASHVPVQLRHTFLYFAAWICGSALGAVKLSKPWAQASR